MPGLEEDSIEIIQEVGIRGSNQSGLRDHNERLVLTILRREKVLPRAELARKTGLSAQTVSVIVRSLEKDGLLLSGERVRGKVGQPSVPMRLAPGGALFLGLKVGRRSAELVLVNFVGKIISHRRLTYRYPTPEITVDFAKTSIAAIFKGIPQDQRSRIGGLGIASPYFMWEWSSTIGVEPGDMASWRGFDLRAEVAALFDFPVFLGNDATCACGAELVFGESAKPADFLYIYIGYFIGGGVVLNGRLYNGGRGNAGAVGTFPSSSVAGVPTQLVDVASLVGLERRMFDAGKNPQDLWESPEELEIDGAIVSDWLHEAVPAISHAVLSAISVIDFGGIVIDGSMPASLREKLVEGVKGHLVASNLSGLIAPDVLEGTIGADARALGAASLPLSKRFLVEA